MRTSQASKLPLYALTTALPLTDFMQVGLVAFSATPIMGALHASPEQYGLVATAYAMVAIVVIAFHHRLIDRLGWRRLLTFSAAALATGALICAFSSDLLAFGFGRVTMALGCASFVKAGRMLVKHVPASPRRFTGVRFFAAGVAWGLVLGPLVAVQALSSHGWRASFFVLLVPASLIVGLVFHVDDETTFAEEADRSSWHLASLFTLMGGSFALLRSLQRSAFGYFDCPGTLWAAGALGLAALLAFGFAQGSARERQTACFDALRHSGHLVGLVALGIAYLVLGANSYMLPLLRHHEFDLALETLGPLLALGALGGVLAWIVVSRWLPRSPRPTRLHAPGVCALLLCVVQFAGLVESASPWLSAMPALICHGAFVILMLSGPTGRSPSRPASRVR